MNKSKITKKVLTALVLTMLAWTGCTGGGSEAPRLFVKLVDNQPFDSASEYGQIANYRLTIQNTEKTSTPIVNIYDAGMSEVILDESVTGDAFTLVVEVINTKGHVVRRGNSGAVTMGDGSGQVLEIKINNVPVFTNLTDGNEVNVKRFVPKIFAPGGIEFEIVDLINGSERYLKDVVSDDASFSVSEGGAGSIKTVYTEPLAEGAHQLTVRDVNTKEATTVDIKAVRHSKQPHLVTTAGGFYGTVMTKKGYDVSNLVYYYRQLTGGTEE
ncbi:MAG: hypothetical protein HQM16_07910 [Deltaproteobacteria bacterium]|nr:hypothetical protein [Deltaproteobacteria bacterium]